MDKTLEIIIIILLIGIIAEVYFLTKTKKRYGTDSISMLIDTSALMDGRVVDLAKTGFLLGQVLVPKSVLTELQLLADGSDHDKRERARLGMDAVKELKDILEGSFSLLQDPPRTKNGVDEQLITLAKQTDSAILTLDYNLNKVAQVEGVKVLNINELAKSLRMVHLPGSVLTIDLVQKGQSADQAVGYLADGTMVVVEQAKKFIGKTKRIEIIRSLQTDAGKMMFAKLVGESNQQKVTNNKPSLAVKNESRNNNSKRFSLSSNRQGANSATRQSNTVKSNPTAPRPRRQRTSTDSEDAIIRMTENQ